MIEQLFQNAVSVSIYARLLNAESLCRYIAATQQRPSDIMHFPAEYQAPQIVRMEQVQAPAGMSVPTSNGYTAPPAAAPASINLPSPIPEVICFLMFILFMKGLPLFSEVLFSRPMGSLTLKCNLFYDYFNLDFLAPFIYLFILIFRGRKTYESAKVCEHEQQEQAKVYKATVKVNIHSLRKSSSSV